MHHHCFNPRIVLFFFAICCLKFNSDAQIPDSIPHPDSLSEPALSELIALLANEAGALEQSFSLRHSASQQDRAHKEEMAKSARQDSTLSKEDKRRAQQELKDVQRVEKISGKQWKEALQSANFIAKLREMDISGQRKNIRKAWKQVKDMREILYPPPPKAEKPVAEIIAAAARRDSIPPAVTDSTALPGSTPPEESKTRAGKTSLNYKPYDPASDVMLNPPSPPCALAVHTRDEFSGETYREVKGEELFRFTNEVMGKILPPGQPHISCEAALSSGGSGINLHLHFYIRDANAKKSFGGLARNSVAVLKFIDGNTLTINNIRNDEGVADPSGQLYLFRGQYAPDPSFLKKIRKTELDKIRIAWNTGYEDYDIHYVNLLMRQINCVKPE
jgi:hypothetical protein